MDPQKIYDPEYLLAEGLAKADDFVFATPNHPYSARLRGFLDPNVDITAKYRMYFMHSFTVDYAKNGEVNALTRALAVAPSMIDWPDPMDSLHEGQAMVLSDQLFVIANVLALRYEQLSDHVDLDVAIALLELSIALNPSKFNYLCAISEAYLGGLLGKKYRLAIKGNKYNFITKTILVLSSSLRKIVKLLLFSSDTRVAIHLAPVLHNIAISFNSRYKAFRDTGDIRKALKYSRLALDISLVLEAGPRQHSSMAHTLSVCLHDMAMHPGPTTALPLADESLALSKEVLVLTPPSGPQSTRLMQALAMAYLVRFNLTGDNEDFVKANSTLHELSQGDEQNLTTRLLACGYLFHYTKTHEIEDLETSIQHSRDALRDGEGEAVHTLAVSLSELYKRTQDEQYLSEMYKLLSTLFTETSPISKSIPTDIRFWSACLSARYCQKNRWYERAIQSIDAALDILPSILFFGRDYREEALHEGGASDLGIDGGACNIECGRLESAVEMIERGRSIGWRRSSSFRASFGELTQTHPVDAIRLTIIAKRMARIVLSGSSPALRGDAIDEHILRQVNIGDATRQLSLSMTEEWNEIIARIRSFEGYEEFLKPPRFQHLRRVACHGPVAVINCTGYRCDAIVIMPGLESPPLHIELDRDVYNYSEFWARRLVEKSGEFSRGKVSEEFFSKQIFRKVCKFLREYIVWPVMEAIFAIAPETRRVWWCPTGSLTFLPMHTITSTKGKTEFISSYTTSLETLVRSQTSIPETTVPRVAAVSCGNALGAPELSRPSSELLALADCVPGESLTTLVDDDATTSSVLAIMTSNSWIQMSCHGMQDMVDPYSSCFLLRDGGLQISQIISENFPKAEFAFLSACQTATGVPRLRDEAMHLAASLHFVGFRATIATMWSVDEETSSLLVREFYTLLFQEGKPWPKAEDTAEALHEAKKTLLNRGVPAVRLAPFIHLGV